MELNPVVLPININKPDTWPDEWRRAADSAKHALRCQRVELESITLEPEYGAPAGYYRDGAYYTASYPTGNHFVRLRFRNPENPDSALPIRVPIGILP